MPPATHRPRSLAWLRIRVTASPPIALQYHPKLSAMSTRGLQLPSLRERKRVVSGALHLFDRIHNRDVNQVTLVTVPATRPNSCDSQMGAVKVKAGEEQEEDDDDDDEASPHPRKWFCTSVASISPLAESTSTRRLTDLCSIHLGFPLPSPPLSSPNSYYNIIIYI